MERKELIKDMDLKQLFLLAKNCKEYSDFCMQLGQIIGIPSTDARCNDIQIVDLLDRKLPDISLNRLNYSKISTS